MHRAYAPSISAQQIHGRTDVTNGLRAVVENRRYLQFRNARAHIRISPFTPRPKAAKRRDPEPADLSATRKRADREVKS